MGMAGLGGCVDRSERMWTLQRRIAGDGRGGGGEVGGERDRGEGGTRWVGMGQQVLSSLSLTLQYRACISSTAMINTFLGPVKQREPKELDAARTESILKVLLRER